MVWCTELAFTRTNLAYLGSLPFPVPNCCFEALPVPVRDELDALVKPGLQWLNMPPSHFTTITVQTTVSCTSWTKDHWKNPRMERTTRKETKTVITCMLRVKRYPFAQPMPTEAKTRFLRSTASTLGGLDGKIFVYAIATSNATWRALLGGNQSLCF